MTRHLNEDQITAVNAGLGLDDAARAHLGSCFVCRQKVSSFARLVAARRADGLRSEPDWESQRQSILGALPAKAQVTSLRPRSWLRPLLAAAAVLLLGVVASVLYLSNGEPETQALAVEQILAEVEATLAEDSLPGFEALDPLVPSSEDFDSLLTNDAS